MFGTTSPIHACRGLARGAGADVRALERDLWIIVEVCEQLGDHEAVPHLLDVVDAAFKSLFPVWPTESEVALTRYLQTYAETTEGGPWSLPPRRCPSSRCRGERGRPRVCPRDGGLQAGGARGTLSPCWAHRPDGHAHLDLACSGPYPRPCARGAGRSRASSP